MSHRSKFAACIVGILVVCLLALVSARNLPAAAADPEVEKVYLGKCAICHGPDGAAKNTMGKKLKVRDVRSAEFQKMTDAQLLEVTLKGKGESMSGFEKTLGKEMCEKLVAHMRALAKK